MASLLADNTPLYRYSPLPNKSSIRLLGLQPSKKGSTISCSLSIIVALENSPPYDALSYTWGDPRSLFSRSFEESNIMHLDSPVPILCDGMRIWVTPNLRDALQMLLETSVSRTDVISSGRSDHIWIDALCINQGDIAERNAQVSLMGELYKRARNVYAWIGQEDDFTEDAMTAMDRLSSIPRHLSGMVTQHDFTDLNAYSSKLGISPLEVSNWLGWIAFLHRPYFQRAWIVQEVSLATNLIMVVGKRKFAWATLSSAISFLGQSVWIALLHSEYLRTKVTTGKEPEKYHKLLATNTDPGFSAMYLNQTKTNAAIAGKLYGFEQLLKNHRYSKASDPRDKIYALIGVSEKKRKPFTTHPNALVPDYDLPVQTLYTRVTRILLQSFEDLRFLSDVESRPKLTKVKDLPSWVPDYCAELKPNPLSNRAPSANWNAGGDLPRRPDTRTLEDRLLDVQGIHIGNVMDTSLSMIDLSAPVEEYWARICGIALGLQDWYAFSQQSPSQTRAEVLWRTLIADTYQGQHPAPISCGQQFLSHVSAIVGKTILEERQRNQVLISSKGYFSKLRSKAVSRVLDIARKSAPQADTNPNTAPWMALIDNEPAESNYGVESFSQIFEDLMRRKDDPTIDTTTPTGWSRLFEPYRLEINLSMGYRKLFQTNNGLLGLGPDDLSEGDEVWVFAGAKSPFALRRIDSTNKDRFQLLGESYVHGMMHGEVISYFGLDTRSIVLE